MCEPLSAIVEVLAAWVAVTAVCTGLGLGLRRLFTDRAVDTPALLLAFWSGWALLLPFLALWHLVLPIDGRTVGVVALAGGVGLFAGWRSLRAAFERLRTRSGAALALGVLAVSLTVAYGALGPLEHFDTGFYHLTSVDWARQHSAVPGLGNLHVRLAFNSTFTLFAALLEAAPGSRAAYDLANSLLVAALLAQAVWGTSRVLRRASCNSGRSGELVAPFAGALLLGPLGVAAASAELRSLSNDLPVFLLQVVLALVLLDLLAVRELVHGEGRYRLAVLALLAAAGVSVKLSFAVFAAGCSFLALGVVLARRRPGSSGEVLRLVLPAVALAIGTLAAWMARGAVLSGYLVLPIAGTGLDVDWRVPEALVRDLAGWIGSLARSTTGHWIDVLDLGRGLRTSAPGWPARIPLELGLVVLAGGLALLGRRRLGRSDLRPALVLLPVAAHLLFWWSTAPSPRFAGAAFALLAAIVAVIAVRPASRLAPVIGAVFLLAHVPLMLLPPADADNAPYCRPPEPALVETRTAHGVMLHVPAEGIQCWRSPLPCTPYPHAGLALRDPDAPERGFAMAGGALPADLHGDPPEIFRLSPDVGLNLVGGFGGLAISRISGFRGVEARRRIDTMGPEGRLLLWVDEPTRVAVRLLPRAIRRFDEEVPSTGLEVRLEQEPVVQTQLETGTAADFELELGRGFQLLTLRLGEPRGDTTSDGVPRGPRWSVIFASIEIRSSRPVTASTAPGVEVRM